MLKAVRNSTAARGKNEAFSMGLRFIADHGTQSPGHMPPADIRRENHAPSRIYSQA